MRYQRQTWLVSYRERHACWWHAAVAAILCLGQAAAHAGSGVPAPPHVLLLACMHVLRQPVSSLPCLM